MKNMTSNMTMTEKKFGKKMLLGGIIGVICIIVVTWLSVKMFSSSSSDLAEIEALLERRATALNQKNLTQYLDCFSIAYLNGNRTYQDLKSDAELWFSQFDSIQFSYQTVRIEFRKNMEPFKFARVENEYHFVLSSSGGKPVNIPNKKELLEVIKQPDGWKITASLAVQ